MAAGAHGAVDGGGITVIPANPGPVGETAGSLSKGIVPGILAGKRPVNDVVPKEAKGHPGLPEAGADFRDDGFVIGRDSRAEGNGNESRVGGGIAGGDITGYREVGKRTGATAIEDDERLPQGAAGG